MKIHQSTATLTLRCQENETQIEIALKSGIFLCVQLHVDRYTLWIGLINCTGLVDIIWIKVPKWIAIMQNAFLYPFPSGKANQTIVILLI